MHIIIQWAKPESDGGNEISNYLVQTKKRPGAGRCVNKDHVVRYQAEGDWPNEGCDYQFRVTAVNAAGNSEPSEASNFISCREPSCGVPRLIHTPNAHQNHITKNCLICSFQGTRRPMTGLERHMLVRRILQPKTENISTNTSVDKLAVKLLEIVAVIF